MILSSTLVFDTIRIFIPEPFETKKSSGDHRIHGCGDYLRFLKDALGAGSIRRFSQSPPMFATVLNQSKGIAVTFLKPVSVEPYFFGLNLIASDAR